MFNTNHVLSSRLGALVAGCLTFTAACADTQEVFVNSEPEAIATEDGQQTYALNLSHDPDFVEFAITGADQVGHAIDAVHSLTPSQLTAREDQLTALLTKLEYARDGGALPIAQLTAATGLDQAAIERLYAVGDALYEKYPWLADKGVALDGQAMQANEAIMNRLASHIRARDTATEREPSNGDQDDTEPGAPAQEPMPAATGLPLGCALCA